jgi:hypothetical protein
MIALVKVAGRVSDVADLHLVGPNDKAEATSDGVIHAQFGKNMHLRGDDAHSPEPLTDDGIHEVTPLFVAQPPSGSNATELTPEEAAQKNAEIHAEIGKLRQEHRDLDAAIAALTNAGCDQIQVQRLKKRKLMLRDRVAHLEDQLTPDIIA